MYFYRSFVYGGWKYRKSQIFRDLETYCEFIGYSRSGHTLIAALLNAHPDVVIGNEVNALKYINNGADKLRIYYSLLGASHNYNYDFIGNYAYEIPNQWGGKVRNLKVIGQKHGNYSRKLLSNNPQLISSLSGIFGLKVKFIHVIRNPYDNISTKLNRRLEKGKNVDLKKIIVRHFSQCEQVAEIKKRVNCNDLFELRHESFLKTPQIHLKSLCHFLGVDATRDYLDDCASIIYKSPHQSRFKVEWSPELIEMVKNRIDEFPFLQGYSYED